MNHKYVQLDGELFKKVQLGNIFDDPKTFVDTIPKNNSKYILKSYNKFKTQDQFDLKKFIDKNFLIQKELTRAKRAANSNLDIETYIKKTWDVLERDGYKSDKRSSFISLPYPYIVAGGRFREIYYWDSFFTSLGLMQSGRTELVVDMCKDFSHLIKTLGFIPNGNRIYYITRSQPPVFSMLLDLIGKDINKKTLRSFIDSLEMEYKFWMKGCKRLTKINTASKRVVKVRNHFLNRYYDEKDIPREESYSYDYLASFNMGESQKHSFYRNIRAGAESGWDFSSRWLKDYKNLLKIRTTDILPVDLNCLLYNTEISLSKWMKEFNFTGKSKFYEKRALQRKKTINRYFWNERKGFFFDYSLSDRQQTKCWSLAGVYPLYFGIADKKQAAKIEKTLREKFLCDGGLVTTLNKTDQQWDYPNGWAPLQWFAIRGLEKYGYFETANEIKRRWMNLCKSKYDYYGKMYEKYDVVNTSHKADGGEYKVQEGFGWTNGVYLDLLNH